MEHKHICWLAGCPVSCRTETDQPRHETLVAARMNHLFQLSTAYIIVGTLFLVMPLATWLALASERQTAIRIWCLGGCMFGLSMLLLGMRTRLPAWASYPMGNALLWFSTLMMVKAMCLELGRQLRWLHMIVATLAMTIVFEYFRLGLNNALLRFSWSLLIMLVLLSSIAWLAYRVQQRENRKSAYWLAGTYALASVGIVLRLIRSWLGHTQPDLMDAHWDGVITSVNSLLVAIFGNMGYIGIYLSRAHEREIAATVERDRHETSARLGAQIAHLDRQRSMSEMSAALAHELGQPLTAAKVDCHVASLELARWPSAPAQLTETIESLKDSISRSSHIVSRIHDFIRHREPVLTPVHWGDVYQDVIALIPARERPLHAQLTWHSEDQDLQVLGDRVQLSQVLLNLLRNALHAHETGRALHVQVIHQATGDDIVLTVCDNGRGIAPETLSRMGNAFFTTKPDGLGVGLAISRTIVQQHGGQLLIESQTGMCTQVRVVLPRFVT